MKKLNQTIQLYIDNNIPFKVIDLPNNTIKLWWSNKGINGYQCITVIYFKDGSQHLFYRTNGYGYDKESFSLVSTLCHINTAPKEMISGINRYCEPDLPFKYHIGGNYYRVPKRDMRVVKRGLRK